MNKMTLTYFDIDGGRAEPIRLAMHTGGIEFVDERFGFSEFPSVREKTPLRQVPVLMLNERQVTQSNSILRYVGKQADLYPQDDFQALLCDEVLDAIEDATHKLVATFGLSGEELKTARQSLVAGPLKQYLQWAQAKLEQGGGDYFIENRLSIADLKVFVWTRALSAGHLDFIPTDLVESCAPKLHRHMKFIAALAPVSQYYQK
ncbi:glutathione S-transferase family protein [Thalassomonas actiniarum]|uniref:Glutathione S-transferase family protein n=1 Tax=Thalassomonas actiniarum TaxID=485447 RepID=A0AAF0C636_9GAMM|nr:glutathione S-transferase family protein [Thalassomonas actiniarum]WDE01575.1 glutathione S-transferase family protein [Thalassomonas actiniarum]